MTTKDILTLAISTVVAGIALGTLIKACLEYIRQGRMERAQMFFDLRQRLKQAPLVELAEWIDEASCGDAAIAGAARDRLTEAPLRTKRDYLGLFEEVDIAMSSGLIRPEIASYMFGYYALRCAESEPFWNGVNRLNPYWNRFFDFCRKMQVEEAQLLADERADVQLPSFSTPAATPKPSSAPRPSSALTAVQVPPVLRGCAGGRKQVDVAGATVGEVLECLVATYPALRSHLFAADGAGQRLSLQRYINVYLDDEDVRVLDGLDTRIDPGARITFLPSASGG